MKEKEIIKVLQEIQLDVACSDYTIEVGVSNIAYHYFEQRGLLTQEELNQVTTKVCNRNQVGFFSVIPRDIGTPTQIAFHGHAGLAGNAEML